MTANRTGIGIDTAIGATVVPDGVAFRLWAPAAQQVFVLTGAAIAAADSRAWR
jgi:1,4-alpha-glucan branching enzyme